MNIRPILRTLYKMERPDFGPDLNMFFLVIRTVACVIALYIALHNMKLFAGISFLLVAAFLLPVLTRSASRLFSNRKKGQGTIAKR